MIFIEIHPQIHIFSEFGSEIRAKTNYKIEIQLPTKRKKTDMGNSYSKSTAYGCPKTCQKQIMEFFWSSYNDKDYTHVLHQLLLILE